LLGTLAIAFCGAWAGARLRLPAGGLLMPMAVAAALNLSGLLMIDLPHWLLDLTYLTAGSYIGLAFDRQSLFHALRALPQLLAGTGILIALCGGSAWALTRFAHTDALTAYLATTPGGLDSVAVIAASSHADVPFVLGIQTLRLFIVILTGPPIAKILSRMA
jgi:membrane AbrB-like protein